MGGQLQVESTPGQGARFFFSVPLSPAEDPGAARLIARFAQVDHLLPGHPVQGAFTGADHDQTGYFDLADGGTLFLDEVGEMRTDLQAKLLRVLEERTIRPLGARQDHPVDVRILAATNAELRERIAAGSFRQDLFYRLAHFTVEVPPLRRRQDDIGLLARHFLALFAGEIGIGVPELSPEALSVLESYDYPGNVRELKNIIERALLESRGRDVQPHHLRLGIGSVSAEAAPDRTAAVEAFVEELPLNFAEAETALVQRALRRTNGNVAAAARLLGIDRTKVYRKLKQGRKPSED